MAVLNATNLHKFYQLGEFQIKALNGVDFEVEAGAFVTIQDDGSHNAQGAEEQEQAHLERMNRQELDRQVSQQSP